MSLVYTIKQSVLQHNLGAKTKIKQALKSTC